MNAKARRRTSWVPYVVLGAIAALCLVVATTRTSGPVTAEDRINAVAKTIKCPTCQGESVADSSAPTSREIRADIADRLSRGETAEEVRAFYANSYGPAILLTPSRSGFSSIVWVLPVLALVGAATVLVVAFRRWRREEVVHATEADRALVDHAREQRDARRST